jgi:hypothetical protein
MITNHHPAALIGPRLAQSFEPIITQKEKNGNSIKITVLLWRTGWDSTSAAAEAGSRL